MADIQMRFHREMLVISGSLDASLVRQGFDPNEERQYLTLMEPDTLDEAYRLQMLAGAQCLATPTEPIAPARLAHGSLSVEPDELARAGLAIVDELSPQHILAEIGPCGLPLDASSKASLNENRDQYARCARAFEPLTFDGYLLSGFTSIEDMRCALMGIAQVSDRPIFATMLVGEGPLPESPRHPERSTTTFAIEGIGSGLPTDGYHVLDEQEPRRKDRGRGSITPLSGERWPEALAVMADLGAAVVGFETAEPLSRALEYAAAAAKTELPVAAFLRVVEDPLDARALGLVPLQELDVYIPDTLPGVALALRDAGVQFLRATGDATPACTGALYAAVSGMDVIAPWQ